MGRRINPFFALAAGLLLVATILMSVAVGLPDWSKAATLRLGLWLSCQQAPDATWSCIAIPDPASKDGFLITARVFGVLAAAVTGLSSCFSLAAIARKGGRHARPLLVALCAASFVLTCLTWGMWLGFNNRYAASSPADGIGPSFILACVASGVTAACTVLEAIGLWLCPKRMQSSLCAGLPAGDTPRSVPSDPVPSLCATPPTSKDYGP